MLKILFLVASLFLQTGCDKSGEGNVITVATCADNPPYEFISENRVTGLDIDIAEAIANKLNRKLVIKNLDINGLLASLNTGNIDFAIAGLSVTPEREKSVDFSSTYLSAKVAVLHRKIDPILSIQDLKGKSLGAQLGTTWQHIADELKKNEAVAATNYLASNLMLVRQLKTDALDAIIIEEAQAKTFAAQNPDLHYFIEESYSSDFAIAFPKGSALIKEVNEAVESIKQDGTIDKLRRKWLPL